MTIETLAAAVLSAARLRGRKVATAESCTGGLVGAALTAIPGSSDVVDRGFITYSNDAKMEMLGVPAGLLAQFGAVSRECAMAMAEGALAHSRADVTVSITGIAGPGGGSLEKPVGLVHFAVATKGEPIRHREARFGDLGRDGIRQAALRTALDMLMDAMS